MTSEKINKNGEIYFILLLNLFETIKIQNKTNGNSLDKKLPTTISSPKKLESLSGRGETNPKILNPKIN